MFKNAPETFKSNISSEWIKCQMPSKSLSINTMQFPENKITPKLSYKLKSQANQTLFYKVIYIYKACRCAKNFNLVPSRCHSTAGLQLEVCISWRIYLPRASLTHFQISHAMWCCRQHNINHCISRLFHVYHMSPVWTCSHLWQEWLWWPCQFWRSVANPNWAASCTSLFDSLARIMLRSSDGEHSGSAPPVPSCKGGDTGLLHVGVFLC